MIDRQMQLRMRFLSRADRYGNTIVLVLLQSLWIEPDSSLIFLECISHVGAGFYAANNEVAGLVSVGCLIQLLAFGSVRVGNSTTVAAVTACCSLSLAVPSTEPPFELRTTSSSTSELATGMPLFNTSLRQRTQPSCTSPPCRRSWRQSSIRTFPDARFCFQFDRSSRDLLT
jgi:hypothetical protein